MAIARETANPGVYQALFEHIPTKAQRRQVQIADGAIRAYVRNGVHKTTYDEIAKQAGVSRPLVQKYFPDRDSLFTFIVDYTRANFQQMVIQEMQKHKDPREVLKAYVAASLDWSRQYPSHTKMWLLFFYDCSISKKHRLKHTELTSMGQRRIGELLAVGNDLGVFECSDPALSAKMIQTIITGALVTMATEELTLPREEFLAECLDSCVSWSKR